MKTLSITERRNDSIVILDLEGNIRLGEGSRTLHEKVRLLVENGEKEILLNLAKVSYVDSCGLGELVAGYTTLQKSDGEMKLLNLTDRVTELMVITKLLTVFDVFENEEEAIESFKDTSENTELKQSA
jgi:anti-sigma B factor antagonist